MKMVEEDTGGRTNQPSMMVREHRESTKHLRDIIKDQNQQLITVMQGILENLQKEREEREREEKEETVVEEPKKRGACFICQDPGHYAPDCPN